MALSLRPPTPPIAAVRPGHRALDHDDVVFGVHLHNFKIANGHLLRAHLSGHAHSGEDARRKGGRSNGTGRAVEHGAVALRTAAEMMPLHNAGEPAALADADDVYLVERLALI